MTNNRSTWHLTVTKVLCEFSHTKMTRRETLNLRSKVSGKGTTLVYCFATGQRLRLGSGISPINPGSVQPPDRSGSTFSPAVRR